MDKTSSKEKKKTSKIANVIGIIIIIIFVPLLIIFTTIAIKSWTDHTKLPDFLGYKPLICVSNSMQNVFEVGDLTVTKEIKQQELKKGDIITFWNSKKDTVITHRIEETTKENNGETSYITKGDMNNTIDDETVTFDRIEGKYVGHVKYIGNLILFLQKPTGLIIAFLIPILLLAGWYAISLKRTKLKSKRKEKLLKKIQEKNQEH